MHVCFVRVVQIQSVTRSGYSSGGNAFLVLQSCCAVPIVVCCAVKTVVCAASVTLGHFPVCVNKTGKPKQSCSRAPLSVCHWGEPCSFSEIWQGVPVTAPFTFPQGCLLQECQSGIQKDSQQAGQWPQTSALCSLPAQSSPLVGGK